MPELPNINTKQLIKILGKRGFILKRQKGSHAFYYHPLTKHTTVIPIHNRDIPRGLLKKIMSDTDLRIEDLK